jgi:hypothetical protein
VFTNTVPVGGSPSIQLSATASTQSTQLSVSLPAGYDGDQVVFVQYTGADEPGIPIVRAVVSGTTATATWTHASLTAGARIGALLYGSAFAAAGFPYAAPAITVPAGQPWTSGELTITPDSLGAVTIGMAIPQASAAAGEPFVPAGDGAYYPSGGIARGLSVLESGPGGTVGCVSANINGGNPPEVITPQGFPLGGTLARLKAVYGASLRFVPAPISGISPVPGYIVTFPDGNLVFWVSNGIVDEIAGGPGLLPSVECT